MKIANVLVRVLLAVLACLSTYLGLFLLLSLFDSAVASALHQQGAAWRKAMPALIHGCSGGVALLVAWQVWKRSVSWSSGRRVMVLAVTALPTLVLVSFFVYGLWAWSSIYYYLDTDKSVISKEMVDKRLLAWVGVPLPQGVDKIHAVMEGGIDPTLFLTFEAAPDEVEDFRKGVLGNCFLTESDARMGEPPGWVLEAVEKKWWTPRADTQWWYGSNLVRGYVFLQVDSPKGRVLIAILAV